MSKAEEKALEAYPHDYPERSGFVEGYKCAEKDLALTWEDIKRIVNIADYMIDLDVQDELPKGCETEQGYYEEILRIYDDKGIR